MPDNDSEAYKRVETVEKEVGHVVVTWQRTQWHPSGKVDHQIIVRTMGSYAIFSAEDFRDVMWEGRNMLRSLGGWPDARE